MPKSDRIIALCLYLIIAALLPAQIIYHAITR